MLVLVDDQIAVLAADDALDLRVLVPVQDDEVAAFANAPVLVRPEMEELHAIRVAALAENRAGASIDDLVDMRA